MTETTCSQPDVSWLAHTAEAIMRMGEVAYPHDPQAAVRYAVEYARTGPLENLAPMRSQHYFATACGHKHGTPEAAAQCPERGFDMTTKGPRPVIEVTIRPGKITRTQVLPDPVQPEPQRPMDTDDIDPETGEAFGVGPDLDTETETSIEAERDLNDQEAS